MKKKIFLTSACALLTVSGVWGIDNNNISYSILSSNVEKTTTNDTLTTNCNVGNARTLGQIVISLNIRRINNIKTDYEVYPVNVLKNPDIINLSNWTISDNSTSSDNPSELYSFEDNEYTEFAKNAPKLSTKIVNISEAKGDGITIYSNMEEEWYTYEELVDINPLYENCCAYKYSSKKFYVIEEISVENNISINDKTQDNYSVVKLPAGFLTSEVSSLTLSDDLTTIEANAFANASNLTTINTGSRYTIDNNILYNSSKRNLYYALPAASGNVVTIPNSVTAIEPQAFANTQDMIVNLGLGCSSFSDNTNNVYIGKILTDGMITNVMLSDANIYTIPGAVTSIQAGAFKNAGNLVAFNVNQNSNFKYENGILYNADYTIVIAAIPGVASQTLPNTVTTVLNYAFANTKIPIDIYVAKNINEGTGHYNVTFIKPSANLTVTPVGNDGYSVNGNITQSNFDAMVGGIQGTYMDFTNCNVMEPLTIDNNTNTLLYFTTSQSVTGNNVINNGTCANLVIKDEAHTKFYCPTRFTATKASYDREMPANWSTICLPFNAAGATVENNFAIGKLTGFNEAENSFTVTYQTSMSAYVPYAIKRESKTPVALQFDNAEVPVTTDPITEAGQGKFTGVLETTVVSCDATWYHYGFTKTGTYARCNNATFHPFRAYFTAAKTYFDNVNAASAGSMRMIDGNNNEMIVVELDNTTDIQSMGMENKEEVIYNMNGQRVKEINAKGMYVVNGKKVMINK